MVSGHKESLFLEFFMFGIFLNTCIITSGKNHQVNAVFISSGWAGESLKHKVAKLSAHDLIYTLFTVLPQNIIKK